MAKRRKIADCDAKLMLRDDGIDFAADFHVLRSSDVDKIVDVAKRAGYRKSKNAPGSTARMYFQRLQRAKSCR